MNVKYPLTHCYYLTSHSKTFNTCRKSPFLFPFSRSQVTFSRKYFGLAGQISQYTVPPLKPL